MFVVRSFIYINKWDSQTHSPIDLSNKTKTKNRIERKQGSVFRFECIETSSLSSLSFLCFREATKLKRMK